MATASSARVAIVTGASRGIGLEIVRELLTASTPTACAGYDVVAAMRTPTLDLFKDMAAPAESSASNRLASVERLDISTADSRDAFIKDISSKYGPGSVHVLVNNAGVFLKSTDQDTVDKTLAINSLGPAELAMGLAERGLLAPGARILNVSSGLGKRQYQNARVCALLDSIEDPEHLRDAGLPVSFGEAIRADPQGYNPTYGASKALLNRISQKLPAWLATNPGAVRVASICPGWVRTDMGGSSADRSVEEGAASVFRAWALLEAAGASSDAKATAAPALSEVNGGFFRDGEAMDI